jgi:phosphohistidine phosphatase SixA
MFLHLVRHGIAIDRAEPSSPSEAERFLTTQGIVRTEKAAKGLRRLGAVIQAAWTSPYVRAVETADIFARTMKFPSDEIHQTNALLPESPPQMLFDELMPVLAGVEHIFCFGHSPNMDLLIMMALGSGQLVTGLKKSGVAVLEFSEFAPGRGQLYALYPAKTLRAVADR